MVVKLIDKDDLAMMQDWWKAHKWTPPIPQMLSPTGILVSEEDFPICAGWYIQTNTETALCEWLVKNPDSPKKQSDKAFSLLYDTIEELARSDGYKLIITFLSHPIFERFIKSKGYQKGDDSLNTYLKGL